MKKQSILIFFLLQHHLGSGYIYRIEILRKWDSSNNRYQYILGFCDCHKRIAKKNREHCSYLKSFFSFCDPEDTKLIIEDLGSPNHAGIDSCGSISFKPAGGLLSEIANLAHEAHIIHKENLEYRYCRAAGFAPLFNQKQHMQKPGFAPTFSISIKSIVQEIIDTILLVQNQAKNTAYEKYAQKKIAEVITHIRQLEWNLNSKTTVSDYTKKYPIRGTASGIESIFTFDSKLFDLKLIHAILKTKNENLIIVIAGGSHIQSSFRLLTQLEYESVSSIKTDKLPNETLNILLDKIIA